jgi:hypothetical protein
MSYAALAALANDYLEPTPSAEDIAWAGTPAGSAGTQLMGFEARLRVQKAKSEATS